MSLLTLTAFVTAALFTIQSKELAEDYYDHAEDNYQNGSSADVSVTSRALIFTALWTGVLALIMAFVGMVVLGITSPTGQYYWCFPGAVHRTTPLSLGTFIGSLFMFANICLVSAVLFGEFKVSQMIRVGLVLVQQCWINLSLFVHILIPQTIQSFRTDTR